MLDMLLHDAIFLWATIDPIGTVLIFAALTARLAPGARRRIALRATLFSTLILICTVTLGQFLLDWMHIQIISFQVAGGIILFLFGLQMVFGQVESRPESVPEEGHDLAIFPLAMPVIAGPGPILAAVVLTDNDLYTVPQQFATSLVLLAILGANLVMMLLAGPILRLIGRSGASVLVRIMGMLLAALSVELVMKAAGVERWIAS
jgi:multiple antibiotic resistance protein